MATPNGVYLRPDIDAAFVEFDAASAEAGFVGLELAPPFMTPEQSGDFPRIPIEAVLEEADTARSPKGGYHQSDMEFEQDSFATREHGAEERIDERQAKIYASLYAFEVVKAGRARYKVLNNLEREIRDAAQSMGQAAAASVAWDQPLTADPVKDVFDQMDLFIDGCGFEPNLGWLTDKLLRKLARVASIKDQIKYSGMDDPKLMTEPTKRAAFLRALADLFGLERLVVAGARRNTAAKGKTFSGGTIWDSTQFGLIRVSKSQDLEDPSAMRTFVWDGDGAGLGGVFETYRNESVRSDMMRFRHERKVKKLLETGVRRITGCMTA